MDKLFCKIALMALAVSVLSCHGPKTTDPQIDGFLSAEQHISDLFPERSDQYRLDALPGERIGFNTKESILQHTRPGAQTDTVRYTKVNFNALRCADTADRKLMERLAKELFDLPEEARDVDSLMRWMGADFAPQYAQGIKNTSLERSDILLSILYNVCVGNARHEPVLSIRDKKILYLGESFLAQDSYSFIDTTTFTERVKQGLPADMSPDAFRKMLTDEGIIVVKDRDFDFCFIDIRGDRIYIGNDAHPFSDAGMSALKDSLILHPDRLYVKLRNGENALSDIRSVLPDLGKYVPFQLDTLDIGAPTLDGQAGPGQQEVDPNGDNGRDDIRLSKWLLGLLLLLVLLGAVGSFCFISAQKTKARKQSMDVINELADRLIAIYQSEDDSRDGDVALYVQLLKNLCGKEFGFNEDFENAEDLIKWKADYNRRYRYTPVKKAVEAPVALTDAQRESLAGALSALSPQSSISDILKAFDQELETDKTKEFDEIAAAARKLGATVKKVDELKHKLKEQVPAMTQFDKIIGSRDEKELLAVLDTIGMEFNRLPKIDTVQGLVDSLDKESQPFQQIYSILQHVDSRYGTTLYSSQLSYLKRTVAYDETAKMIQGADNEHMLPTVLKEALDTFVDGGQTLDGAIDFLERFRPANPEMKGKEEILREHHALLKAARSYRDAVSAISQNTDLNYWDRLAFLLASLSQCAIPVLDVIEPDNTIEGQKQPILDAIKSDLLLSYLSRYFLRDSQAPAVDEKAFREEVTAKVDDAVSRFNASVGDEKIRVSGDSFDAFLNEKIDTLATSIGKIRGFEASTPFFNGMWNAIVKEFLEKAREMDETYIIQQALNIAYHTADFLDHIQGGRGVMYCYNYEFLLHQFDPEQSNCHEFVHHDYAKSTEYSNFIYELAEKHGIEHLKILVDNYFIKP